MFERKLPNWIDSYVQFTRHDEAPECFHRWTAFAVLSAAINRNCWMDRGYYKTFPNLYILFVGPSGVGKSTSSGIGVELLRESTLKLNIYKDSITPAALIDFMSRSVISMELEGKVIQKTPLLLYASELGNLLSVRTGVRELTLLLTELFNKQGDHEDTTIKRTNIKIKKPCLTFLGCCFPSWIEEELISSALRSGFLGRMLVVSASAKRKLSEIITLTDADVELKADLLNDLEIIGAMFGEMRFSEPAETMWRNWYMTLPTDFSQVSENIEVEGFIARKAQFVQRIAMLLSISRGNSMTIEIDDIQEARKMIEVCEGNSRGLGFKSEDYRLIERLKVSMVNLAKFKQTNQIQLSDLMPRVSKSMNARKLAELLEQLIIEKFCNWMEELWC